MSDPSKGRHPLSAIFEASSIAVVGASSDPAKRGNQIIRALQASGYEGSVFPVNPKGGSLLGLEVSPTLEAIGQPVELAVVCTPARTTPEVIAACGRAGVKGAVILAVGFGESGSEGAELEEALLVSAKEAGVRIVGPNTSGIGNLPLGMNLIGAQGIRPGGLALLVQSGNMALALMKEATEKGWNGISVCAGLGNESDIGFGECLEFLAQHEPTKAVLMYVEGISDGRSFLETASRISPQKPIVMIKSARSEAGQEAARSHTGAVGGSYARLRAGLAQAGVVEVERSDELMAIAECLAFQPSAPSGTGVAILSDGGGQGTLSVDSLSEMDVRLADLSPSTRESLEALLGPAASTANPVDLAGAADADPSMFGKALEVLAGDPDVGAVLVVGLFGGYGIRFSETLLSGELEAASHMAGTMSAVGKPLVVHTMYADARSEPLAVLGEAGVPVVGSLDIASRCVAEVWKRGQRSQGPVWSGEIPVSEGSGTLDRIMASGRATLTEPEAQSLLSGYGLSFPEMTLCRTAEEAQNAVEALEGLAVLKVVSPRIPHKTDAGGVELAVAPDGAAAAFRRIVERGQEYLGGDPVDGVLVCPLLPSPEFELLIGACRDPQLGPVLTVGAGGVWVEVLKDVSHRVLPVGRDEVREMFSELRIAPILAGIRGSSGVSAEPLVDATLAVANAILAEPLIEEVEVNPLFAYGDEVVAADAMVFLKRQA